MVFTPKEAITVATATGVAAAGNTFDHISDTDKRRRRYLYDVMTCTHDSLFVIIIIVIFNNESDSSAQPRYLKCPINPAGRVGIGINRDTGERGNRSGKPTGFKYYLFHVY
jgi:hypothetical protein